MQRVRDSLRASGLTVWTDEGIEAGTESWKIAIEQAIEASDCLLVILTPKVKSSRWVREEISYAEKHGKKIYAVLAEGDEKTSIPFGMTDLQFVDIRTGYEDGIQRTIRDICKHLNIIPRASDTSLKTNTNTSDKKPKFKPNYPVYKPPPIDYSILSSNSHLSWVDVYGNSFYISRYPITNKQYMDFINHRYGYHHNKWWNYSDAAIQWYRNNGKPMITSGHEDTLPVVKVSWYEAVAFCFWLSEMEEHKIMLPTEKQWRTASLLQQEDPNTNVAYPWGDVFDSEKCNFNSLGPTPVNKYANPDNPSYYPEDMSGNVWEWCYTEETKGNIPLNQANDKNKYILKGGSWRNSDIRFLRIDTIISHHPNEREDTWGFRVVRTS